MNRFLLGVVAVAFITVGLQNTAHATATLELVSGTDTLYVTDGGSILCTAGTCASFGASGDNNPLPGAVTINASNFDGWSITLSSGSSNSPSCPPVGVNGVGCVNDTNINAQSTGSGTLSVYFADTGFNTEQAFQVAFSAPQLTGVSASQTAYAFTGALPLGSGVTSPVLTGQIGSTLTFTAPGVQALSTGGAGLTGPFNLLLATTFTAGAGGGAFNANGNITAVPEPTSMLLVGSALLGLATLAKKKLLRG